ncbi:transposase [Mycobacterium simiae]|uniref:transposase n=1 Tax=Mycobacterium simiae TaxID=1784 RepID=UPI001CB6FA8D|nr:transposase [Mycobacterium simiae]
MCGCEASQARGNTRGFSAWGLLSNGTNLVPWGRHLPIAEHTTDTAGQTLATFAIFHLAGLQFSPRIRDIGRLQLYRLGPAASWRIRYPHAGPLLTQPIQTQLIAGWSGR